MDHGRQLYTKTWKVSSFADHSAKDKDAIYITKEKFDKVAADMLTLYARASHWPEGIRFSHRSIEGLAVIVDKDKHIITAEAWEESNISVIIDELDLPAYSSED
jgi:hypothetical protein